jgi:hypothetical protein
MSSTCIRRDLSVRRRGVFGVAGLMLALVVPAVPGSLAQEPGTAGADLAARLPATIDGGPVTVAYSQDLEAWLDAVFPGQSHPEVEALATALAAQGLSFADVATVSADFGPDGFGVIQGFGIPGGDAAGLLDAFVDTYLIGMGEMERTEREIGDHPVTFLSEGPLEAADYPFAVLPDTDVLWILNAEMTQILDALEALLAVAAGTAPGNTTTAPPTPAEIGPAGWTGTMSGTLKWTKGAYVGEAKATFRGTLERLKAEDSGYCLREGPCLAYVPMGEVEWLWESKAPGPPSCDVRKTGVAPTGDVVTPRDQMLIMEPAGADHLVYWGSGTVFLPPQDCVGWESDRSPSSFFEIPEPNEDDTYADVSGEARPGCHPLDWRIEVDAEELKGTCWGYDERGYEERYDWDLTAVDPE